MKSLKNTWWALPLLALIVSAAIIAFCFSKCIPLFTGEGWQPIIIGVLLVLLPIGLLGFGFYLAWLSSMQTIKKIEFEQQKERTRHEQRMIIIQSVVIKLADLARDESIKEKDGKTIDKKLQQPVKLKLVELIESILKP